MLTLYMNILLFCIPLLLMSQSNIFVSANVVSSFATGNGNKYISVSKYAEYNPSLYNLGIKVTEKDLNNSILFANTVVNSLRRLETNLGWSDIKVKAGTPSHGMYISFAPEREAVKRGREALIAVKASRQLLDSFCNKAVTMAEPILEIMDCQLEEELENALQETALFEPDNLQPILNIAELDWDTADSTPASSPTPTVIEVEVPSDDDCSGESLISVAEDPPQYPDFSKPIFLPVREYELCWRCGYPGHNRYKCRGTPRLFCSQCGRYGIMSRDCTCTQPDSSDTSGKSQHRQPRSPHERCPKKNMGTTTRATQTERATTPDPRQSRRRTTL